MAGSGFAVSTEAVEAAGGRLLSLSQELSAARGGMSRLGASAEGSGHPALGGAVSDLVAGWERALAELQASAESLGASLDASAGAYETVDATTIPRR